MLCAAAVKEEGGMAAERTPFGEEAFQRVTQPHKMPPYDDTMREQGARKRGCGQT
jgi:hypothetical protein